MPPKLRTHPDHRNAKRIIRAIVKLAGGRVEGRTRLYKAFYASHLFHWKSHGVYLTTHPIVHMPNGPGIDRGSGILEELEHEGFLKFSEQYNGPYTESVYESTGSDADIQLT